MLSKLSLKFQHCVCSFSTMYIERKTPPIQQSHESETKAIKARAGLVWLLTTLTGLNLQYQHLKHTLKTVCIMIHQKKLMFFACLTTASPSSLTVLFSADVRSFSAAWCDSCSQFGVRQLRGCPQHCLGTHWNWTKLWDNHGLGPWD